MGCTPFYSRIMASFDHVIAISKTVESYVNDNYKNHLKSPPRLIYRGSDDQYFSRKYQPKTEYAKDFYRKFPNLESKKLLTFPGLEKLVIFYSLSLETSYKNLLRILSLVGIFWKSIGHQIPYI